MSVAISSVTGELDYQDYSSQGFDQNVLIGRSKEIHILRDTYQKVKTDGSFEIVFVHGESGSGKTSLALTIREEVFQSNGFFCSGKYFQSSGLIQEPYSAIMAAFSDLCDLTIQSDTCNTLRRKEIQQSLCSDGQLLVNSVTNISPFLDDKPQFGIKHEFAFAKFRAACKIFLRTMASFKDHPVVIFLDDIQWMDKDSKELVKTFLQDTEMKNLLLVLAYRDDGEEEVKEIKNILPKETRAGTNDISLENLQLEDVYDLVQKKLSATSDEIRDLGALTFRKTQGNPFHVLQFISTIQRDGSLQKCNNMWIFDLDHIQCEMMVSNSVAALLSRRVQCCDEETKEMLKVASLLGYNFPGEVLIEVVLDLLNKADKRKDKKTADYLQALLKDVVDSQFLEETQHGYQFSHDKIQSTFQSLMENSEKERLHFAIGRNFLKRSIDVSILQAAVHLNRAGETHVSTTKDKVELADINLKASKYCECRSAFSDSASFLRKGLVLLDDENKWSEHFDLAFDLVESLARMEFKNGNLGACRVANREALQRAKSIDMKIKLFILEIDVLVAANDGVEIIKASRKMLKELGLSIPRRISIFLLLKKLYSVRRLLARKTDEEILGLRDVKDSKLSTAIQIMVLLSAFSFSKQNVNLRIYLSVLVIELTIAFGLLPYSCVGFVGLGFTELLLGNEERGRRLGNLALKLVSRVPCSKEALCFVTSRAAGSFLYFNRHYQRILPMCNKSIEDSLQIGDMSSASLSATTAFYMQLFTGDNLRSLEKSMDAMYCRIGDFARDVFLYPLKPLKQLVLNMLSRTDDWESLTILTGTIMNEKDYRGQSLFENNDFYHSNFFFCKMVLAYTFGFQELAQLLSEEVKNCNFLVIEKGLLSLGFCFYSAMIYYSRYQSAGKRKYLRSARKFKKILASHHKHRNPNANPFLTIIEVEELALKKSTDPLLIIQACDASIRLQAEEGFNNLEALANEQADRIMRGLGKSTVESYRDRAIHVYSCKWEAKAKSRWLQKKQDLTRQYERFGHNLDSSDAVCSIDSSTECY